MPYNYRQLISGVLVDLDDPDIHHPTVEQILQVCGDVGQMFHNQLQNTSVGWGVSSVILPPTDDNGRALVTPPNFGKALRLIVRSQSGSWLGVRQIDIVDRQNLLDFQRGIYQWPTQQGYGPFTTSQVAILEHDAQGRPYIEFNPATTLQDAEYVLYYETATTPDPTLGGDFAPQVKAFHPYARLKISMHCLPYAQWTREVKDIGDPVARFKITQAKREELRKSLGLAIVEHQQDWDEYITTNRQTGASRPRLYADWYESSPYWDNYNGPGSY